MKTNLLSKLALAGRSILIAALSLLGTGALKADNFFDNSITMPKTGGGTATIDLGNASGGSSTVVGTHKNWAIFALSGGVTITDPDNSQQNTSLGTYDVLGNVGMGGSGSLSMTNGWIQGSVYQTNGQVGSTYITNSGNVGPSVDANYLNNAAASAASASAAAQSMLPATAGLMTTGFGAANTIPTTIALSTAASIIGQANQTYVLNLQDLILSGTGAMLTLDGASTTNYVINVSRYMSLSAMAQIQIGTSGIGKNNILYNLTTATTNDVTLSGGAKVDGIILAPNRNVKLTGGSVVYGEVIAKGVSLSGRSKVLNPYVSP